MLVLLGAVAAGMLTTLAPCVLPLLPVIVGGSLAPPPEHPVPAPVAEPGTPAGGTTTRATPTSISPIHLPPAPGAQALRMRTRRAPSRRAVVIAASLGASVIAFSLALQASTALIDVPRQAWQGISGGLLVGLGMVSLVPRWWEATSARLALQARAAAGLSAARRRPGVAGEILTGAALGPVFSSCSPLYGYVVVTAIPAAPAWGVTLLVAYAAGLCGTLLVVALLGQRAIRHARWAADPHGWFRRGLGLVFVAVGLLVLTGTDRTLQTWILDHAWLAPWTLDRTFLPSG